MKPIKDVKYKNKWVLVYDGLELYHAERVDDTYVCTIHDTEVFNNELQMDQRIIELGLTKPEPH